ncbi:MAG: hypothetical protein M3N51_08435 [Actinomycetota bacterium]|nr:hypothetical protein [Actinomycetota bacterium]
MTSRVGSRWEAKRSFYAAFLAGPLLVGALADAVGLRAALSLFVLTSLAIPGWPPGG